MTKYLFTNPDDKEAITGILANDFGITYPPFNMQGYLVFPIKVGGDYDMEWVKVCQTLRQKGYHFKTI